MCVWIWERSWRRQHWGGGMLRVWVHDRVSHYQQHRPSWDLIIYCSHCLHQQPPTGRTLGLPVLECVHVWKGHYGKSATKSVNINSWEKIKGGEGGFDWFKRWLNELQVTANVKGPSYRPSLPPSHPATHPAIFALLLCLSVAMLSEKYFTFSAFVLLCLLSYHHSALLHSPPLQLEQLVSPPLCSHQPHPLNPRIALPHSRHHLFTPA